MSTTKGKPSPITVWTPPVAVPGTMIRLAARLMVGDEIDVDSMLGIDCVTSGASSPWHDDRHIANWSLLWVVRNDPGSWVESKGRKPITEQPVGTAVLLEIRRTHRLNCSPHADGGWVALCWNEDRKPGRARCEALIRQASDLAVAITPAKVTP